MPDTHKLKDEVYFGSRFHWVSWLTVSRVSWLRASGAVWQRKTFLFGSQEAEKEGRARDKNIPFGHTLVTYFFLAGCTLNLSDILFFCRQLGMDGFGIRVSKGTHNPGHSHE